MGALENIEIVFLLESRSIPMTKLAIINIPAMISIGTVPHTLTSLAISFQFISLQVEHPASNPFASAIAR